MVESAALCRSSDTTSPAIKCCSPRVPPLVATLLSGILALAACTTVPTTPPDTPATLTDAPAGNTEPPLNQAQLEQLLAPIALYPDALLAQILMAATYPLEVVQAAQWRKSNPAPQGKALEDALVTQPWDASVKSLTAFPPVLEMMNERIAWTQQLGDALLSDQKRLLEAVQSLRRKANAQGSLETNNQQAVFAEEGEAAPYLRIEPADPEVLYVPAYDPTYAYGAWPYPDYPPHYYYPPGHYPGSAFWTFTAGIIIGSALWGDCDWNGGGLHVEHQRYNKFSRSNVSGKRSEWKHNIEHRRDTPYRDRSVARRYGHDGATRITQTRQDYRGRAESGQRADTGQRGGGFSGIDQGRRTGEFQSRGSASRQATGGGFRGGRASGGRGGRR